MALTSSSPATAAHPAVQAAKHGASKARASTGTDGQDEGGDFAAQLLRARPQDADLPTADAQAKPDAARKTPKDDDGDDDAAQAPSADARPAPTDPNALPPWAPAVAPPTTSLADKPTVAADDAQLADDPLGALRKAASAGKGGRDALLAGLDAGRQAAPAAAGALGDKGMLAAGDMSAALAKAEGAANAATNTRDGMAALLPQADPVAVQAGAVGASPNALLDPNAGANQAAPAAPAQAALAMPPQSPTFVPALGQQIELWMKGGVQHAEVQLSPLDLGPIRVKIEMAGAQARVEMSADVQSTRDALQQALPQLSDQLGQVGLSLTGGGVSDQPAFQSPAQAQANADGGFAGARGGRQGGADSRAATLGGGDDFAAASAARQAIQRRGLLDMYA